ncbi:hypothetical protein [Streptomyces sp. YIM 98790]|uniref:hypothetical protein n=1 Tax=Streptomyces sp. YIM 98790 TaxID=2689077 RepID=UPI00140D0704|nr:hypothetical protein [Streptomyces sp. YIM 98790]
MHLIRLSIGSTSGTAHWGVMLGSRPLTVCSTYSPDLAPTGDHTAHSICQACARAFLILTAAEHAPGPALLASGAGARAAGHLAIPGHLRGYCGKSLDRRPATAGKACANCTRLASSLTAFLQSADGLVLPPAAPCHSAEPVLWALRGRADLTTGHRRNAATGRAFCGQPLWGENPGALRECSACLRHYTEAAEVRLQLTVPHMRNAAEGGAPDDAEELRDRAAALRVGDAFTVSGCPDEHRVVAVTDLGESQLDVLVYVPGPEQVLDVRVPRDRLVTIRRRPRSS